jgi:hypothetical protein
MEVSHPTATTAFAISWPVMGDGQAALIAREKS